MRLGVCTGLENIELIEKAGFDYIEPTVQEIANLSEEEFKAERDIVERSSIKAEAFNVFIPTEMKVVGDSVNMERLTDYVKLAVDRISYLGAETIVFGSGGARRVPEGFSKETALNQLTDFLDRVNDIVKSYGIVVVIEPLPLRSCNIINNVLEGLDLAKRVNKDNIKLLADFWHILYHDEDLNNIVTAGDYIRHIHVNNTNGGKFPKIRDINDYTKMFRPLREIGYEGRMSIEAQTSDLEKDVFESMDLWKSIL